MKNSISNKKPMSHQLLASTGGGRGRVSPGNGGRGGRELHGLGHYLSQDKASDEDDSDEVMETMTDDNHNNDNHNKFYNGATPWSPPPNADDSVFHPP
jgi:hypothetical protein